MVSDVQRINAATPEHLRSLCAWTESANMMDFVIRTLKSADDDGNVLLPGTLDGYAIYTQMIVCGFLRSPGRWDEPMRFEITPAGRKALGE